MSRYSKKSLFKKQIQDLLAHDWKIVMIQRLIPQESSMSMV